MIPVTQLANRHNALKWAPCLSLIDLLLILLMVIEQHQYLIDYSSGYGLREAVLDFPNTIGSPGTPVIASM